eukprot:jgi/Galph1/898/GphlegSOOS_G5687.1
MKKLWVSKYLGNRKSFSQSVPSSPEGSHQFASLTAQDISYFKSILPGGMQVIDDADTLHSYNTDWLGKFKGNSKIVLKPNSTEDISKILRYCHDRKLALVPQGGNTGLVGGSTPMFDEVIINLGNMKQIRNFDEISGILTCEAGVVLENVSNFVSAKGYTFPLDLGAKGSCQIGGNLATNAGGTRFLRYGSLQGSTLGLEVVLADGTKLDLLSTLRKDNTGYHLKHLFIGSEGTLGIITAASILCPKKSKSVHTALLGVKTFDDVKKLLVRSKDEVGEILSAFEFMDNGAVQLALTHLSHIRPPFKDSFPFYVLIETSGSNEQHDMEKLEHFLESCYGCDLIQDAVLAQDQTQMEQLWNLRESLPEAVSKSGKFVFKYDLSIPLEHFYDLVKEMQRRLAGYPCHVVSWGHIGDSNLHLNISSVESHDDMAEKIEPFVYEWTVKHGGSISAEHGLGRVKSKYLNMSKSNIAIELMKEMKRVFDPLGILNPYKLFPQ